MPIFKRNIQWINIKTKQLFLFIMLYMTYGYMWYIVFMIYVVCDMLYLWFMLYVICCIYDLCYMWNVVFMIYVICKLLLLFQVWRCKNMLYLSWNIWSHLRNYRFTRRLSNYGYFDSYSQCYGKCDISNGSPLLNIMSGSCHIHCQRHNSTKCWLKLFFSQ